jgi:hypothetical protein
MMEIEDVAGDSLRLSPAMNYKTTCTLNLDDIVVLYLSIRNPKSTLKHCSSRN